MFFYKTFVKKVSFPIICKREGMGDLYDNLNFLEQSQFWSPEKIHDYQIERIRKLLIHAYQNTPYYKGLFDETGFNPYRFRSLDDLQRIPVLRKNVLNSNLENLVARNFIKSELHKDGTGGSTGVRTEFYRNNSCLAFKKAIEFRINRWAGWDIGDKIAYYWPAIQDFVKKTSTKSKVKNWLGKRTLMLYSGKLNEEILSSHYSQLASFKPVIMRVFPNPLSMLARYIKETGKPRIHVKSIISVGEPLLQSHRELFSEVFGAKVYNCYVSRECGNMAAQCDPSSEGLHVSDEMILLEFEEGENPASHAKKILMTDLVNYGMPFIRYQIEDMGSPITSKCACGRGLSMMTMEAGRASEFLISPLDGSRISGSSFLHHMIAEGPKVGQIQVIQDEVDHLIIRICKDESFSERKLQHFDRVINRIFRGTMKYSIEYTDHIRHEPSGKYMFTKCMLS